MHLRDHRFAIVILLLLAAPSRAETRDVDYARDIQPILSNHCFTCHGPDDQTREADLRLDQASVAISPGNAEESELLQRISTIDEDIRMPPPDVGDRLSDSQIDLIRQWIDQGATYPRHWSFEPIVRSEVPVGFAATESEQWIRNPIDAFILRKLAEHGIKPSEQTERETLIRRVSLDLLGLPPTLEQIDAFVHDDGPDALERLLDRTLDNKHFGERWGRHWLDQARYADSHGYTNDNERSMWPYRDWVIDAFNRDLPFDQFTIEQLAGDLMDSATIDQRIATGFHRNTLINSEGGTKADQFRDEQVKDRVDTTGLVWMGLTVGCAKCHSHKFDPLSQTEYYRMYAFFNSTADRNSVTPTLKVPSAQQTEEMTALKRRRKDLGSLIKHNRGRDGRQKAWEESIVSSATDAESTEEDPVPWTVLELSGKSNKQSKLNSLDDQSLLVGGKGTEKEEYQSTARSPLSTIRSVRLEVLTHDSLPKNGPGRAGNGNFVLSEFWFRTGDGRELRFSRAGAEHSQSGYEISKTIDGKLDTGWAINGAPEGSMNRNRTAWFVLPAPLEVEVDHALVFKMQFHQNTNYGIGRYRISISDQEWFDRPSTSAIAKLLSVPKQKRSKEQQQRIDKAFLQSDPELRGLDAELDAVAKQIETIGRQIPTTMVLQELDKPRATHVQTRGDFLRPADEVAPGVPGILPQIKESDSANRLEFARWLVDPKHPLTARVRVNRIWMRLFGRGLVETENDFGIQGTQPTHPELLDWLASEFIQQGWSTKKLLRLIMSSSTYQQSSHAREDLRSIDPRNLLLARQSRLRVEAEIVRDLALSVGGALSEKLGGPSVFPPQPDGVYAFTQRKKNWKTSQGDERFRRGIYTFFYRSAPYPMLSTFDVPKFNTACTCRDRSNTPLQSLTMANSDAILELAGRLGERLTSEVPPVDDAKRIQHGYRLCFARMPQTPELERMQRYVDRCRDRFDDESKVWAAVARVLINLDEFVTRE